MSQTSDNPTFPNNLPVPLTAFIGRKREVAEVKQLLLKHRLVTLTGPGGCGKTRLILKVGRELQGSYANGVWLTEFASVTDEKVVPLAVMSTLGIREGARKKASESIAHYLNPHQSLLLFDNCEHLVKACARLSATLLESCPDISILVTSREPLGVPGEVVWAVQPLSLPDPQPWLGPGREEDSLALYQQSEAIQLFIARAEEAFPGFKLTIQNGSWVANLCRRLDGIPLAIELAAARLRTYSVRQISERLDDRFRLLTSNLRTTPTRHKTLEATIDWSYALLAAEEQNVFQRLAVFANGWTLEAAEAVCTGEPVRLTEMIDLLSNLVDKSLVIVSRGFEGRRRYNFLETIRQYAQMKLMKAGEADLLRDRHRDYFVGWAEMGATHLTGSEQSQWLERIDSEIDNLRAALDWSQVNKQITAADLRLAAACGQYWKLRGFLSEGRESLTRILNQPSAQERTELRATVLLWTANLTYLQSDYQATRFLAEEALEISRELGPSGRHGVAWAFDLIGESLTEVGDYETAQELLANALAIYQELDEKRGIADMLMQLGWTAMRLGAYKRAGLLLNESLPLFRKLGESFLTGLVLSGLGELALRQGHYDQAKDFLEESLSVRRKLGERWGIAVSLGSLGWVALLQRDFEGMREALGESLVIRMETGDQGGTAWCLEKLAQAIFIEAQPFPAGQRRQAFHRAAQLFGAAAALRGPLNSAIDLADKSEYEAVIEKLRGALGVDMFEAAWTEGGKTPLQAIHDLALAPVVTMNDTAELSSVQAAKVKYGGLSSREREAAILISQGKTNREIAGIMVVREKTVETYITRILNKLGFNSRVQIATWALEVGLSKPEPDG